jgi:release factor glutamine methyltransferase
MVVRALVQEVAATLAAAERLEPEVRADALREAQLLVAGVLDVAPGDVIRRSALGDALTADEVHAVQRATVRRARGEPLAYCVGRAAFRDLVLAVDRRVLIPRPETEIVVEEALRVTAGHPGGVAVDIGTGSGAIALALATEGRFAQVIATDLSLDALAVAQANAAAVAPATPVEFRAGADLAPVRTLKPEGSGARVIVSNPPYIAYTEAPALPASVRAWEPPVALFADHDGMARYEALLAGAPAVLEPGGWLVLELDATRAERTADLARAQGYSEVRLVRDLAGRDRVLVARWTS